MKWFSSHLPHHPPSREEKQSDYPRDLTVLYQMQFTMLKMKTFCKIFTEELQFSHTQFTNWSILKTFKGT